VVVVAALVFPTNDPEVDDGNQMKDMQRMACMFGVTTEITSLGA
jgi:hypothetical protein